MGGVAGNGEAGLSRKSDLGPDQGVHLLAKNLPHTQHFQHELPLVYVYLPARGVRPRTTSPVTFFPQSEMTVLDNACGLDTVPRPRAFLGENTPWEDTGMPVRHNQPLADNHPLKGGLIILGGRRPISAENDSAPKKAPQAEPDESTAEDNE